jgi:hypothetical protein
MSNAEETFFPDEYKHFPFKEGDLLVSQSGSGNFSVNKVLKIDRILLKADETISIQGQRFVLPIDDFLLVVSTSFGADEFDSFEDAAAAAASGQWTVEIGHIPNRPPGAAEGQVRVGWAPVEESELEGYRIWKEAFDNHRAGIF